MVLEAAEDIYSDQTVFQLWDFTKQTSDKPLDCYFKLLRAILPFYWIKHFLVMNKFSNFDKNFKTESSRIFVNF